MSVDDVTMLLKALRTGDADAGEEQDHDHARPGALEPQPVGTEDSPASRRRCRLSFRRRAATLVRGHRSACVRPARR